jgi:hypothetical protein
LQLADGEKVEVGVVAARIGVRFFEGMGLVLDEWVEIPGYEKHIEPVRLWIGTRVLWKADKTLHLYYYSETNLSSVRSKYLEFLGFISIQFFL